MFYEIKKNRKDFSSIDYIFDLLFSFTPILGSMFLMEGLYNTIKNEFNLPSFDIFVTNLIRGKNENK